MLYIEKFKSLGQSVSHKITKVGVHGDWSV